MNQKKTCPRVLVADDLPEILEQVRELLSDHCEVVAKQKLFFHDPRRPRLCRFRICLRRVGICS
jgi:hypothetical protein